MARRTTRTAVEASGDSGAMRGRILDIAQRLIQDRGYNGFSYRDVAAEIGIRAPTIHHYFPAKSDLAAALVERYAAGVAVVQDALSREEPNPWKRLARYFQVTRQMMLEKRQLCLCGVLAMEANSLPESVRQAVDRFFADGRAWIAEQLRQGKAQGEIDFAGAPGDTAAMIMSTLQGGLVLSRASQASEPYDVAMKQVGRFLGF